MPSTDERPKRPTITDVAALAGVSKGAVSRAFNGGVGISVETAAMIRKAAEALDWSPSSSARAVSGGPAEAIGLVVRRPAELLEIDPFFPAFLAGVEGTLSEAGFSAVIRFVSDAAAERHSYRQLFTARRVDGFLLTDLRADDFRFRQLTDLGAPTVVAGSPDASCPFPSVGTEGVSELRQLIEHLIAKGHKVIGHVAGLAGLTHSIAREDVWRQTLIAAGLEPGPLVPSDYTTEGGARATLEMLERRPVPTAIVYGNDMMAIAGMSVLASRGIRIPEDMAVAGIDGIRLASYVDPPLTTIHRDYRALGSIASGLLLDLVRGEPVNQHTELVGSLELRASTGD